MPISGFFNVPERHRKTRDDFGKSSRVFEKSGGSFGESVRAFVRRVTPVRRRANTLDRENRCTGISAREVRAHERRAVHGARRCSAFVAPK